MRTRLWLSILWAFLMIFGAYAYSQVWTQDDLPIWLDIILRLPLTFGAVWTFVMLYDTWIGTRKTEYPNKELAPNVVPSVSLEHNGLIYIDDVLYRYVERSTTYTGDHTSSVLTLESVGPWDKLWMRTIKKSPDSQ